MSIIIIIIKLLDKTCNASPGKTNLILCPHIVMNPLALFFYEMQLLSLISIISDFTYKATQVSLHEILSYNRKLFFFNNEQYKY